ncbi:MAG: Ig domain-containing protein, partial [Pirellula sp.]
MFHNHLPLRLVSLMLGIFVALALGTDSTWAQSELNLVALPSQVSLQGNFSQAQLLVRHEDPASTANPNSPGELAKDLTSQSHFESLTPEIVTVSASGCLTAVANGAGKIRATCDGKSVEIPVEVSGIVDAPGVDFHRDLLPLITRSGCNAGSCHASQYGKGGLVLSVMAFDPMLDYQSLAVGARSRRINTNNPHESLLLKKATGSVAHGGGARFSVDSNDYRILARWIELG